CYARFTGWRANSLKQNNHGVNIFQSLITPKVQVPNLAKRPALVARPFLSAVISAPLAIFIFNFEVPYELAGLGLNSMIAPLNILVNQGIGIFVMYLFIGVCLPAVISVGVYQLLERQGKVIVDDR